MFGHHHRLIAFTIPAPALEAAPRRCRLIVTKHHCGTLPSLLLALATVAFLNTCSHNASTSKGTLRSAGPSLSEQRVSLHTPAGAAEPRLEGTWFTSGFQGAMGELLCAIEDKRAPDHDARGNLDGLALCFAALAGADTGRPVTPGETRRAPGH